MTRPVHVPDEPYEHRLQVARLRYVAASEAAARSLSENYVGLPAGRAARVRTLRAPVSPRLVE